MSDKELRAYHLAESMRKKQAELQNLKKESGGNPTLRQQVLISKSESEIENYKSSIKEILDSFKTLSEAMKNIQTEISPERNIDRMMRDKKTEAGKQEDNRQYSDIGNDQRTITNSVTVNATGLDGIANAVKTALNASNLIKATTASTAAITAS